jgi:hypothetical protein
MAKGEKLRNVGLWIRVQRRTFLSFSPLALAAIGRDSTIQGMLGD